ncbi:MAG: hypothetical protein GY756_05395 [bacterium]|nr:hypothetical protein [bacterium]
MKNLLSAILIISVSSFISAQTQIFKLDNVYKIKNGKMIIGLTENESLNEALKTAVENFWNYNEVVEYLPKKEALKKARNNDNLFVLSIGTTRSKSMRHGSGAIKYRYVSSGKHIEISSGSPITNIKNYIPSIGGKEMIVTEEFIAYGISSMLYLFRTMEENELKNSSKYKASYKIHSPKLKSKTLYLLDSWVNDKLKKEDIEKIYNAPIEVVTQEKWTNAILSKEEGIAYCIVVPVPGIGQYAYLHYIVDAQTGMVLGIGHPKAAVSFGGVNVSRANTGYINKKNIQQYSNIIKGKW